MEEITKMALDQFFHTQQIKDHSVLFLIVDGTISNRLIVKMGIKSTADIIIRNVGSFVGNYAQILINRNSFS